MKALKALFGATVLSAALTVAPMVHAQSVHTDYDHQANFGGYQTFSFARVQMADPLMDSRVKQAITQDLQARGWRMVPQGGDVAVTVIGNVQNQQQYNTFYEGLGGMGWGWRGWGGWGGGAWGGPDMATTTVQNIPVGTMMVDLYDRNTHQMVFRGTATGDIHKHAEKNTAEVDKAVHKMFEHFPPHAG